MDKDILKTSIWTAKENYCFEGTEAKRLSDTNTEDIVILESERAIIQDYDEENYKVIIENINNDEDARFEENENYTIVMAKEK